MTADLAQLFEQYYASLVRMLYRRVGDRDRAEDLAQEAFLELLRHWGRVARYDRPGAWVRRVAIRKAVQATNRESRRSWFERRAATSVISDASSPATGNDGLEAAVRSLPPQQRAVVALFYYEDMSVEDVAGMLGCTVSTVKVHLHRARETLRSRIPRTEGLS